MQDEPTQNLIPIITTLFLDEPGDPDYAAIISDIAKYEKIEAMKVGDNTFVIKWKDTNFISSISKESSARYKYYSRAANNVFWPEALKDLARHKATLNLVSCVASGDLLESLINQTLLVRGFLEHLPVCGVQWGSTLIKPAWFEFLFQRLQQTGRLPIPAWVQIQMTWGDGKTIVSTNGMKEYGFMDVECNPSPLAPDPTLDVVQYFIGYLLQAGPVIQDGNTFELAEEMAAYDKPMRVHHAESFRKDVGTVYLIDFFSER